MLGSAALGAAAAGIAAAAQAPGRVVASKTQSALDSPRADELKSKLKSSFSGTSTKKRKPGNGGAANAVGLGGPALKTKARPSAQRSSATAPGAPGAGADSRRDAQLVLARIEPWSVMKFSFMVSLAGWIIMFIAVALLFYALKAFGVFHYLEQSVSTLNSTRGNPGQNGSSFFSAGTVLGYTMLVGAINVVLITALATVGAVIYNVITHFSGGVEVTLREAD